MTTDAVRNGTTTVKPPPGVVVAHSPAATQAYIGSPSLVRLPGGTLLASHDLFGPGSTWSDTHVYASDDDGATWRHRAHLAGQWWSSLLVHGGALYILGTTTEYGDVVIRRSDDGGRTWTTPDSPRTGLLRQGQFHTAPMPFVEHDGRIWRAMEDASGGEGWGERFAAFVMSAPLGADLLDAASWTSTNALARENAWLPDGFRAWLEGNAVVTPEGELVDVLRVDSADPRVTWGAIVHVSPDGTRATFDPKADLIEMPGGITKFAIRRDPVTGDYVSLVNHVPDPAARSRGLRARNTLALARSADLRTWRVSAPVLEHADDVTHGFQYVDWFIEDGDLLVLSRTAWDEPGGTAHNHHDANYLTFHRLHAFREVPVHA
ncbi:putative periplasmic protein [Beutenbergia cavernae DSM 12333]|uniref:Putative periplasmic protein n=1 Tax=Beutenbergia cavernae (strain ATCC BAA-8 / DSM 12333 / CCUG 43141 / JCM 11478 / NBRC 16432 / NCIMB 13614 / HKI 0122) TaxID=471853 RepID=C5C370_BEUC1|nr:sialidase family protein [Beutenbergia cavernae]ACQ79769.1 putative periplasmic protein [Beutenbergia cavernae DSM 12333]